MRIVSWKCWHTGSSLLSPSCDADLHLFWIRHRRRLWFWRNACHVQYVEPLRWPSCQKNLGLLQGNAAKSGNGDSSWPVVTTTSRFVHRTLPLARRQTVTDSIPSYRRNINVVVEGKFLSVTFDLFDFVTASSSITWRLNQTTVTINLLGNALVLIVVAVLVLVPVVYHTKLQDKRTFLIFPVTQPTMICVLLERIKQQSHRQVGFRLSMSIRS